MSSISDSAGNDESKTASVAIENDQRPHLHNIADESEKPNEGKYYVWILIQFQIVCKTVNYDFFFHFSQS